jgi:hypothetical protein
VSGLIETHMNVLVAIALGLGAAAVVVALVLLREIRRMRKPFKAMAVLYEAEGTERALEGLLKGVDENREFIRGHSDELKRLYEQLNKCFYGVGLVKYNAFEDVGGNQSYSLCMLTKQRNGYILTSLVGRNATRSYALDVVEGKPSRTLSDEEQESLGYAERALEA